MSGGYGKSGVGFGLTRDQSSEMIVRTCIDNGITDHRQIAYVLATAQHESRDFAAAEEDWVGSRQWIFVTLVAKSITVVALHILPTSTTTSG